MIATRRLSESKFFSFAADGANISELELDSSKLVDGGKDIKLSTEETCIVIDHAAASTL